MKFFSIIFLLQVFFLSFSCSSRPHARFLGLRKGKIDKITFLSAVELELQRNNDSLWTIINYEFNYSCNGKIYMKQFNGKLIQREVFELVKSCSNSTIADFRRIKVLNRKTGKTIEVNDIMITVE